MKRYFGILLEQKRPLRFLLARGLSKSGLCRIFKITQSGYRLYFHSANLSEQLWIDPKARIEALEFFSAYLKPGDKVIDVGANIGDTVLTASRCVGQDGHVWAIEPHPRIFHFLADNLTLNAATNVTAINCAVGGATSEVPFTDDRRDDMNRVGLGPMTVSLRRLDDLIPRSERISLLKVDVEGYEKPVLLGAHRTLDNVDCIHVEVSKKHFAWYGYAISDLLELLQSNGFKIFRIPMNGHLREVDVSYETDTVENFIGARDPTELCRRTDWNVD